MFSSHHDCHNDLFYYSEVSGKVNKICKAFRDVLMELGRDQYIQSILSTYVKSTPPDLESALQLLADIKRMLMKDHLDPITDLCSYRNKR